MSNKGGDDRPGSARETASATPRLLTECLDEGLARLEYLVAEQRGVGLIVGPAGSGKTFLARQFARAARRGDCDAVHAELIGLDERELVWNLLAQLGVRRHPRESRFVLWRALADRLAENRFQRRPIVLLLDGIEHADKDVAELVLRLEQLAAGDATPLTCVLIARTDRLPRIDPRLLELVSLRIEMEPWGAAEATAYVQRRFASARSSTAAVETAAVEQLLELTRGHAREVAQLTELALIAQQDQNDHRVDRATMVAVFEELSGQGIGRLLSVK